MVLMSGLLEVALPVFTLRPPMGGEKTSSSYQSSAAKPFFLLCVLVSIRGGKLDFSISAALLLAQVLTIVGGAAGAGLGAILPSVNPRFELRPLELMASCMKAWMG